MSLTTNKAGDMKALADGLLFLIEINSFITSSAKHHFVEVVWTESARQEATSKWESNESENRQQTNTTVIKNWKRELTIMKMRSKTRETGCHREHR